MEGPERYNHRNGRRLVVWCEDPVVLRICLALRLPLSD